MKFLEKERYPLDQRIYILEGMVRLPPTIMVNPVAHPIKDGDTIQDGDTLHIVTAGRGGRYVPMPKLKVVDR